MQCAGAAWYAMAMIAAYVRVSSKSQDLAMQKDAICRVCKARGDRIGRWYEEKVSTRNERPQLRRLRDDAQGGGVSKLYVYRLDRLSRGGICETVNLVTELRTHGCKVESIADGFSFEGPGADIVLAVLAWAAEMERNAIRERIASARARVEAHGGSWGRPSSVDDAMMERIEIMRGKGYSLRRIGTQLKIAPGTVASALSKKPTPKRSVSRPNKKTLKALVV